MCVLKTCIKEHAVIVGPPWGGCSRDATNKFTIVFSRKLPHTKYFVNIFSRSIRETKKFRFLRNTFSLPTLVALFRATPSFTHRQGMVLLLFLIIQHIGLARGRHYRGMQRSWPCVAMFRIRIFYYADPGPYFSPFGSGSGEGDSNKTSQIRK